MKPGANADASTTQNYVWVRKKLNPLMLRCNLDKRLELDEYCYIISRRNILSAGGIGGGFSND